MRAGHFVKKRAWITKNFHPLLCASCIVIIVIEPQGVSFPHFLFWLLILGCSCPSVFFICDSISRFEVGRATNYIFFWWLRVKIFLRFLLNLLTVSLRGSRVFRFLCVFLKKEKRGDLRSKLSKIDLRDHTRVLQTPRTLCRWCGRISRLIIAAVVFQHFSRKLFCF